VLITVAADQDIRVREIAREVGITERAVQRILRELADAGALVWERVGRRNHYRVCSDSPLRHPIESHRSVADLLLLSRQARVPTNEGLSIDGSAPIDRAAATDGTDPSWRDE
jgi:alkylated DNA nucleotide flippase Atl1